MMLYFYVSLFFLSSLISCNHQKHKTNATAHTTNSNEAVSQNQKLKFQISPQSVIEELNPRSRSIFRTNFCSTHHCTGKIILAHTELIQEPESPVFKNHNIFPSLWIQDPEKNLYVFEAKNYSHYTWESLVFSPNKKLALATLEWSVEGAAPEFSYVVIDFKNQELYFGSFEKPHFSATYYSSKISDEGEMKIMLSIDPGLACFKEIPSKKAFFIEFRSSISQTNPNQFDPCQNARPILGKNSRPQTQVFVDSLCKTTLGTPSKQVPPNCQPLQRLKKAL